MLYGPCPLGASIFRRTHRRLAYKPSLRLLRGQARPDQALVLDGAEAALQAPPTKKARVLVQWATDKDLLLVIEERQDAQTHIKLMRLGGNKTVPCISDDLPPLSGGQPVIATQHDQSIVGRCSQWHALKPHLDAYMHGSGLSTALAACEPWVSQLSGTRRQDGVLLPREVPCVDPELLPRQLQPGARAAQPFFDSEGLYALHTSVWTEALRLRAQKHPEANTSGHVDPRQLLRPGARTRTGRVEPLAQFLTAVLGDRPAPELQLTCATCGAFACGHSDGKRPLPVGPQARPGRPKPSLSGGSRGTGERADSTGRWPTTWPPRGG